MLRRGAAVAFQTVYCRKHRLARNVFSRWLKYLAGEEAAGKHAEYLRELRREEQRQQREENGKRRQSRLYAVSTDMRSRGIQAFWAMHVEAMNWSGMSVREYAAAQSLLPTSLKKWRDRLDDGEVEIDWRAHLYPSDPPKIRTGAKGSAKDCSAESGLIAMPNADPPPTAARTAAELDYGRHVFAPVRSDPEEVRQHVLNQETAFCTAWCATWQPSSRAVTVRSSVSN